jgi:hypothetical protein
LIPIATPPTWMPFLKRKVGEECCDIKENTENKEQED